MIRRRLCTCKEHKGPRWLPLVYFHVKEWGDENKDWVAQYQSWCIACQRVYSRRRKAVRQGRDPELTGPKRAMSSGEKKRRKAAEFQRRMRKINPETGLTRREELRALQREAAAGRRREAGISERGGWKRYRVKDPSRDTAPVGPLLGFVREWVDRDDRAIRLRREGDVRLGGWEVDRVFTQNHRHALRKAEKMGYISVRMVDSILLAIGRPDVFSVLYGDGEVGLEDSVAV